MRVETVPEGNKNDHHKHRGPHTDDNSNSRNALSSATNLNSTGKGAKKRRVGVLVDEAADAEEDDDEDDEFMGSSQPPAPITLRVKHLYFVRMVRVKLGDYCRGKLRYTLS